MAIETLPPPPPPGASRVQVMAYISALLRDAEREATHVGLLNT